MHYPPTTALCTLGRERQTTYDITHHQHIASTSRTPYSSPGTSHHIGGGLGDGSCWILLLFAISSWDSFEEPLSLPLLYHLSPSRYDRGGWKTQRGGQPPRAFRAGHSTARVNFDGSLTGACSVYPKLGRSIRVVW